MVNVVLKGVDEFLGGEIEETISSKIAEILHINIDEVIFTCFNSMIFHKGVDQTSYHMIVTFELNSKFRNYEKQLADFMLSAGKNYAVHCLVNFYYFEKEAYSRIDENYPLFIDKSNEVVVNENSYDEEYEDDDENYSEEEVYTGDVFLDFENQLKNLK